MLFVCTKCKRDVDVPGNFCPYCGTPAPPPPSDSVDPFVGRTIAGKYFIHQKIGTGGMGQVYKATDVILDRPVALKMLSRALATDPQMVQRFHREARAASRLNHPNAITILDFGQTDDGTLYIVMEFLAGRSLSELLHAEFPLTQGRVVRVVAQILSALADAHGVGIIHRDLKLSNVMVEARRDEPDFVKVLDFGIAKIAEPNDGRGQLTSAGMVCGTPGYMSPEQARGDELDLRSDLYSVGVILYELLTGKLPFESPGTPMAVVTKHLTEIPEPPRQRRPDLNISQDLNDLVVRVMAKDRNLRPSSAEEMRSLLLTCKVPVDGGHQKTPPPQRSATVLLDVQAVAAAAPKGTPPPVHGTPPVIVAAHAPSPPPVKGTPPVIVASHAAGTPAPAAAPPIAATPSAKAKAATPKPAGKPGTPKPGTPKPGTPKPAKVAPPPEEEDEALSAREEEGEEEEEETIKERRRAAAAAARGRTPKPAGPKGRAGGKPASKGPLFAAIGGGVVVLGLVVYFVFLSDPFEPVTKKDDVAPPKVATLKLNPGTTTAATDPNPGSSGNVMPATGTDTAATDTTPASGTTTAAAGTTTPATDPTTAATGGTTPATGTTTAAAGTTTPATETTGPVSNTTTTTTTPVKPPEERAAPKKGSGVIENKEGVQVLKVPAASSGKGVLRITASPWATVFVDGKEYGETPRELLVGAGYYKVKLEHPTFGTQQKVVTVAPGGRAIYNARMAQ